MDNSLHLDKRIHYTLRFAAAMCFFGHGAFGIIRKSIWLNYFAVFGIGHGMGYQLMPIIGVLDILMGISLLIYPTRAILAWLVLWGFITALCRPLSGEPFVEAIERAGNYGAPLALLILSGFGSRNIKTWFAGISPATFTNERTLAAAATCLRIVVFLLLVGHGWLNLVEKKGLLGQYASLGFSNPAQVAHIAGVFEIVAALSVLIRPIRPVLLGLLIWKMGTELFYPHWEAFEWIERGGSYGAILALWFILPQLSIKLQKTLITT
ncbi:MAG TPA: DoxX family membrane protein [Mucilaginibacter sp.]|nr:DoxX family membrane protein [Mucilaginibacter sp.]